MLYLDFPIWEVCGDACAGLAHGYIADIYLHPVAMYKVLFWCNVLQFHEFFIIYLFFKDPFRPGDNHLVMCETYSNENQPTITNHRKSCKEAMDRLVN
jgi:hypothetical protein